MLRVTNQKGGTAHAGSVNIYVSGVAVEQNKMEIGRTAGSEERPHLTFIALKRVIEGKISCDPKPEPVPDYAIPEPKPKREPTSRYAIPSPKREPMPDYAIPKPKSEPISAYGIQD